MEAPSKAVLGITPAVTGSVEANQVLQLAAGFGEPLIGKLWSIDLRTMESYIIDLP
jgi:adenylyltransferase/sulfurtransferase